jgi:hypothetical protein
MKFIKVKVQVPGFHCWANAPEEVEFLKNSHRHLFYIEVDVEVLHGDRDVEFFTLQKVLTNILKERFVNYSYGEINFKGMSCEMIAEAIEKELAYKGIKCLQVYVSEDNENGGGYRP